MNFRKNNDLDEVFDQRWKANYGQGERIAQAKKDFNSKMFGIQDKNEVRRKRREAYSVNNQVNNLNQRINSMRNIGRINKSK